MVDGVSLDELLEYDIEFFEADIQVDAILSYPWLFDNRIGLFPHHSALALDSPQLILLYGVNKTRRRGLQQVWERIDTTPTHEPKGRRRQRKRRERERSNWDWERNPDRSIFGARTTTTNTTAITGTMAPTNKTSGGSTRSKILYPPPSYVKQPTPPVAQKWGRERWRVRENMYNDILHNLGVGQPLIEIFADEQLHVTYRWWRPGSTETQDAFTRHWGSEGLLWCNPPYIACWKR